MKTETFVGIRDFGTHRAAEFTQCGFTSGIVRRDLATLKITIENASKYPSQNENVQEMRAALAELEKNP